MNLSTELLVGIILIGMGLLLGAAAYMVLSSRKGDEDDDGEEAEDEVETELLEDEGAEVIAEDVLPSDERQDVIEEEAELISEVDEVDVSADLDEEETTDEPEPTLDNDVIDTEEEPDVELTEQVEELPDHTLEEPEPEPFIPEPKAGPRIQVATLLRDEVSGELIVQVGDREYRTADDLRDSSDWTRVEFAASDLTKWIDQPIERPKPERESEQESADRAKPLSMIEQINEILQEKIEASGQTELAVRLIEGMEGTAKVLIGVHSYDLGEVPDEAISKLIREAVSDWEAGS